MAQQRVGLALAGEEIGAGRIGEARMHMHAAARKGGIGLGHEGRDMAVLFGDALDEALVEDGVVGGAQRIGAVAEHDLELVSGWYSGRLARRTVEEEIAAVGPHLDLLARNGARVMVCGGRDMAAGVADALGDILPPNELTPVMLKAEGRYVEDVY